MSEESFEVGEVVALKIFKITLVGAALFAGTVFVFIL